MRNPANDGASVKAGASAADLPPSRVREEGTGEGASATPGASGDDAEDASVDDGPNTRRCILTGERADPATLIRLAHAPDGTVLPDVRGKAPGRGAWIAVDRDTLEAARARGRLKAALSRAFKTGDVVVPDDLPARIESALERAALDRLGLEARSGTVVIGGDRLERALREGRIHLLLHTADAGPEGTRKLDQAWRVGRDAEGSGERGLEIAAPRTILSLALGRENVVHAGVGDRGAAGRVRQALDRWHRFIGFKTGAASGGKAGQPCESVSQGPTPAIGATEDNHDGTGSPRAA